MVCKLVVCKLVVCTRVSCDAQRCSKSLHTAPILSHTHIAPILSLTHTSIKITDVYELFDTHKCHHIYLCSTQKVSRDDTDAAAARACPGVDEQGVRVWRVCIIVRGATVRGASGSYAIYRLSTGKRARNEGAKRRQAL